MARTSRVIIFLIAAISIVSYIIYSSFLDHEKKESKLSEESVSASWSNPTKFEAARVALKSTIYAKYSKQRIKGITIDELNKNIYLAGIDFGDKTSNIICRPYWDDAGKMYWKIEPTSDILKLWNKGK